jgi:hypothetical protein
MKLKTPREIWVEVGLASKTKSVTATTIWYVAGGFEEPNGSSTASEDDDDDIVVTQDGPASARVSGNDEEHHSTHQQGTRREECLNPVDVQVTVVDGDEDKLPHHHNEFRRDLTCWWDKVLRVCAKKPNLRVVPALHQSHGINQLSGNHSPGQGSTNSTLPRPFGSIIAPICRYRRSKSEPDVVSDRSDAFDGSDVSIDVEQIFRSNSHLNFIRSLPSSSNVSNDHVIKPILNVSFEVVIH